MWENGVAADDLCVHNLCNMFETSKSCHAYLSMVIGVCYHNRLMADKNSAMDWQTDNWPLFLWANGHLFDGEDSDVLRRQDTIKLV